MSLKQHQQQKNGKVANLEFKMAKEINDYFTSVFTVEDIYATTENFSVKQEFFFAVI